MPGKLTCSHQNQSGDFWSSLPQPWQACLEESWRAYCAGCVPIGAVITDAEGNILARGRNRINETNGLEGGLRGTILAHAELNALIQLDRLESIDSSADGRVVDPHTCVLYSTTEPCPLCMGAFYMSGLRQLHFASRDPYAGSTNLLGKTPYLSRKPIRLYGPLNPDLELALVVLFLNYAIPAYKEHFDDTPNPVFEQLEITLPGALALGEKIYKSGDIRRMRQESHPASLVFNRLAIITRQ